MDEILKNPWHQALGMVIAEIINPQRAKRIAEALHRLGQDTLVVSIPGHTMRVCLSGSNPQIDPMTMDALGDHPTTLKAEQVFALINAFRAAIRLPPLDPETTLWNPYR